MNPTFPLTIAHYAAVLGLLGVALTINVIRLRVQTGVDFGDGGMARLSQAIRAQGNFAEQTPITLLLVAFVEMLGYHAPIVQGLGAALLLARLLSAWGLLSSVKQTFGRQAGAGLTQLTGIAAAVLILITLVMH